MSGNLAGAAGAGAQGFPFGSSGFRGAGGGVRATAPALLTNSTIAANAAGGSGDGVDAVGGALTEYGSVIAGNGSQNCLGAIADDGYDVTYPGQSFSDCAGVVADPKLGQLGLNGGGIATVALGPGSSAIDIEPAGGACPAIDERGVTRPQQSRCDAGAYESAPPDLTNATAAATGATTATASATIDPHLQSTAVVVRYGTTAAYDASTRAVDAGSADAPLLVSVPLTGLRPSTTYHVEMVATNADGTTTSTDHTLTTTAGARSGGGAGGGAPAVSHARQSARRWLAGRALATFTRKRSLPVGTTFTFALNEAATVTLTFTRRMPGRLANGHCITPTPRNRRKPKCSRIMAAGRLSFNGHIGANRVRFYGRLSRRARLKAGSYTVTIIASTTAGQRSGPTRLNFTIVNR